MMAEYWHLCSLLSKPTKKNESEYTSGTSMLEIPLDYEGQPEAVIIYIRPKDFQEAGMII